MHLEAMLQKVLVSKSVTILIQDLWYLLDRSSV